jgi:hypothetical protein
MNLLDYWKFFGTERARLTAERARIPWSYYRHLARRFRRPSVDLARRLIKASKGNLTLAALLFPDSQRPKGYGKDRKR